MKAAGPVRFLLLTALITLQLPVAPVPVYGETTAEVQESASAQTGRPVVAVALAGGGAWGFAHVGVLETIEALGIPVDIVVGTSIGGIVGALYAAGYTTEQLVIIAETTNWNDVLFDAADRLQLGYEDRRRRRAFRATLGFRDGEALLPSGVSSAQRVVEYLDDFLRIHAVTDSFLDMPRKLAIVAADLVTGEEVIFTDGDLKTAVRASISVPGAFAPVYYDGRYLIDGGWVNNIPVDVARDLGADIVIAVNLSVMDREPDDLQSIGSILDQSARILRQESILRNLELADLVITPNLSGLLPTDFQRAGPLIERGREAARDNQDKLEELAELIRRSDDVRTPHTRQQHRPEQNRSVVLTAARYVVPPVSLPAAKQFNPGAITLLEDLVERMQKENTTIAGIQQEVYALYDTGLFAYISYDVVDRHQLVVYAIPREMPRSTLSLGLGLRGQLLENTIGMGLAHMRYRYDPGDGSPRIIADGWLSRTIGARVALEIPATPHLFVTPAVYAVGENTPFYDERSIESFYVRRRFGGEAGLQAYFGRSWDIGLVGFGEWLALQRLEGTRIFDFGGTARYGGRLEIWRDTLDRDLFPTGGSETHLAYRIHWDSEQEQLVHLVNVASRRYWTPDPRLTIRALARGGTDMLSGVAVYERFFLGGVENWYGYYYNEMQTRHYAVAGLEGRVAIGRLPLALGDSVYLVGGTQYGGIHEGEFASIPADVDPRIGVHLGVAFDTALGALHIGAAINGDARLMSYIELGPVYTMGGTGYDW